MPNLSENPHLQELLKAQGLTISPKYRGGIELLESIQEVEIGSVTEYGTVVGFSFVQEGEEPKIMAVIYDEAKEGQPDALTVKECR